MVKIYTKTGDNGDTGLIGGKRISKASLRIDAYGTVDELNAALGVVNSVVGNMENVTEQITQIQKDLHIIGADLANPDMAADTPRIVDEHIKQLEDWCDGYEELLPPLTQFILPGGGVGGAQLHFVRTVTRRAERCVIALAEVEDVNESVIKYLNRLSDLLFLTARFVNVTSNHDEVHPDYD